MYVLRLYKTIDSSTYMAFDIMFHQKLQRKCFFPFKRLWQNMYIFFYIVDFFYCWLYISGYLKKSVKAFCERSKFCQF